jgi:hypothetical protein
LFKAIACGHRLSVYPLHGEKHPNPTRENGIRSIAVEEAVKGGKARPGCPEIAYQAQGFKGQGFKGQDFKAQDFKALDAG